MRRRTRRRVRRRRRRRRRRLLLIGGAIVLGGAFAGYKLSKRNAQQIEERSGKSVDEMSDDELRQYMDENNIQPEKMSDDDHTYAKEMDSSDKDGGDYTDQLERLAHLKDEGVITEEEFAAKKKELLGRKGENHALRMWLSIGHGCSGRTAPGIDLHVDFRASGERRVQ
jgi:hypothetical protein